jgi:hypothetical protein
MSQTMTLNPTTNTPASTACPTWCTDTAHFDESPHFGGMFDIDLSLSDPTIVATMDGTAVIRDFLTVALFQGADEDTPVIGLSYDPACDDNELPDMTLDEAESLARALLELVRRGRAAA